MLTTKEGRKRGIAYEPNIRRILADKTLPADFFTHPGHYRAPGSCKF